MKILKINLTHWSFIFLTLTMQTIRSSMVLDETFGIGGIVRGIGESQSTAVIQSNEKLIVAHYFHHMNRFGIVRYNRDGSRDETFEPYAIGEGSIESLTVQRDNQFVAAVNNIDLTTEPALYRYSPNGFPDVSFIPALEEATITSIVIQPDGKIIVGGGGLVGDALLSYLARYNPDGSFDESFEIPDSLGMFTSLHLQPDGKIIAAGSTEHHPIIIRYNTDGSPDETFGTGSFHALHFPGTHTSLILQPHGKIIAAGTVGDNQDNHFLACYNPNGTLDTSFGPNGDGILRDQPGSAPSLALQSNGKILVLTSIVRGNITHSMISCYNPDGTGDTTFGPDGTHTMTLPHNFYGTEFLFDADTQTITIAGDETFPDDTIRSILIRYRTLSPLETAERRLAALAVQEAARLEAEIQDFMDIGLERKLCGICLEEGAIHNFVETECHHFFHPDCITGWRTSGEAAANSCPMCRAALPARQQLL